jgi:aminopeptidase-like protein
VFLIANTNSNSTSIRSVLFEYSPAVLSESDLESIKDVDFINSQNDVLNASPYVNSYMNFGYDMTGNHTLVMEVNRRPIANDGYDVYIDFTISDTSVFYVDFININSKNITIYVNNQQVFVGSNTIVTLRMNANETVTVIVYS